MDRRQAEAEIHKVAASDSGRVILLVHAKKRKPEIAKDPLTKAEIVSVLEGATTAWRDRRRWSGHGMSRNEIDMKVYHYTECGLDEVWLIDGFEE